jgi:hypothetical protein
MKPKPANSSLDNSENMSVSVGQLEIVDNFTVSFSIDGLTVNTSNLVAIDIGMIKQLRFGQVYTTPFKCFASSVIAGEISKLHAALSNVEEPKLSGLIADGVDGFINALVEAIFTLYKDPALQAMPTFVSTAGKTGLNEFLLKQIDESTCPAPAGLAAGTVYFDFKTSKEFAFIRESLDKVLAVDNVTGEPKYLNQLITEATKGLNPEGLPGVVFVKKVIAVDSDLGQYGKIILNVSNLKVSGLNSFTCMRLLEATSPYSLLNAIAMGKPDGKGATRRLLDSSTGEGLQLDVSLLIQTVGGTIGDAYNNFNFTFGLAHLSALMEFLAKMDRTKFDHLTLDQLWHPDCILATFTQGNFGITNFTMNLDGLRLGLDCASCGTEYLNKLDQSWKTGQSSEELAKVVAAVNKYFVALSTYVADGNAQDTWDQRVRIAPDACDKVSPPLEWAPREVLWEGKTAAEGPGMNLTMNEIMWLILAGCGILCCCCPCHTCPWTEACDVHSKAFEEEVGLTEDVIENISLVGEDPLVEGTKSLITSGEVPNCCRIILPGMFILCIALFCGGHLLLVISVDLKIQLVGINLSLDGFETLSLREGIDEMIKGEAWMMVVMIILGSVIWPYVRMLTMLALFCLSPKRLHPTTRGTILVWLDFFAKWSMFDIYTLVVVMVIMNLKLTSPTEFAIVPMGFFHVEVRMNSALGLYANFAAQVISQVASHLCIMYHRREVEAVEEERARRILMAGGSAELEKHPSMRYEEDRTLCAYVSEELGYPSSSEHGVLCECILTSIVVISFLIGMALFFIGCSLPVFQTTMYGIVGILQDFGPDSRQHFFTVWGLGSALWNQQFNEESMLSGWTSFGQSFGIWVLTFMFFICTVFMPILQALIWIVLWSIPVHLKNFTRMIATLEIIGAWQYFEVFLIAAVISVLQIGRVAYGITDSIAGEVGGGTDTGGLEQVQSFLEFLSGLGIMSSADAGVFHLTAQLEVGAYVLLAAAFIIACSGVVVNRWAANFLRLREAHRLLNPDDYESGEEDDEENSGEDEETDESYVSYHPLSRGARVVK